MTMTEMNKTAVPDGWLTTDILEQKERHLLPNEEIRISLHVASKLCFCKPIKSPPYDVTLYSHRNISRVEASNEVILQKSMKKKVSARVLVEVKKEMTESQKADQEVIAKMGLTTNEDILKTLESLNETADILRRYLAVNA
jgi:hypothetical protein